jgi:hypothetical protein
MLRERLDTFDLEGVKEQVRQNVEDCMQQADVTSCLEGKVDAVSDGLGDKVSKADRDDAKIKVVSYNLQHFPLLVPLRLANQKYPR